MSRQKNTVPVPKLRERNGRWSVVWTWKRKVFWAAVGSPDENRREVILAQAALAFRGAGDWPVEMADAPALRKYLRLIDGGDGGEVDDGDEALLAAYEKHLLVSVQSEDWARLSMRYLHKLAAAHPGLMGLSKQQAHDYLDHIGRGKAVGTKNHYLQALSHTIDHRLTAAAWDPQRGLRKCTVKSQ